MNFKKFAQATLISSSLLASAQAADRTPQSTTNAANNNAKTTSALFNGKTSSEICKSIGNKAHMIMDKSEGKLIACQNGKPVSKILNATSNPKITLPGTYKIDAFNATKTNHNKAPMPYAMHVNMPQTKNNAIWVHEARLLEPNGNKRISSGCIGIHYKESKQLFDTMKSIHQKGENITITIQE